MVTKKLLCWRKNNTTYSAHLHTTQDVTEWKLRVYTTYKIGSTSYTGTLYCPSYRSGDKTNKVCFCYNSETYHVEDITPRFKLCGSYRNNPEPYAPAYIIDNLWIQDTGHGTINNVIDVIDEGGTVRLQLPAGARLADLSSAIKIGYYRFRLKIGSWRSSLITPTTRGTSVDIPEAQWGV